MNKWLTKSRVLMALTLCVPSLVYGAPPDGYYDSVDLSSASAVKQSLHEIIDDHTKIPYTSSSQDTWDVINQADQDPFITNRILTLYKNASYPKSAGGNDNYNREHLWPVSYGFPNDSSANYPYSDLHALFAADISYNSSRSNLPFGTCDASCLEKTTESYNDKGGGAGTYPGQSNWRNGSGSTGTWEVWEDRKGNVARAMFYMAVRYEGDTHGSAGITEPDLELTDDLGLIGDSNTGSNSATGYMGRLSVLLQWHEADPVDDAERARNDVIYAAQGNRNPFIDHPEYVAYVFTEGGLSGPNTAPTAMEVFAAVMQSTGDAPQSVNIALLGSDVDFDDLTYNLVSLPESGAVTDPGNNDLPVSAGGALTGRIVTYTPEENVTAPASLTYSVSDGESTSPSALINVTVYDGYHAPAKALSYVDPFPINPNSSTHLGYDSFVSQDGQVVAFKMNLAGARVAEWNGSTWVARGSDTPGTGSAGGPMKISMSLNGENIAENPYGSGHGPRNDTYMRVLGWDGLNWSLRGGSGSRNFIAQDAEIRGSALSAAGDILALSHYQQPYSGVVEVSVFTWQSDSGSSFTGEWKLGHSFTGGDIYQLGKYYENNSLQETLELSSDGRILALPALKLGPVAKNGVVIYEFDGEAYTQKGSFLPSPDVDEGRVDPTDISLSLDGLTVAISYPDYWETKGPNSSIGNEDRTGMLKVFRWDGSDWAQLGADIKGKAGYQLGQAISLSGAGDVIAVSHGCSIAGNYCLQKQSDVGGGLDGQPYASGWVATLKWDGFSWQEYLPDITPVWEEVPADYENRNEGFGYSLHLSPDAQFLAVGAPQLRRDGREGVVGRGFVYDLTQDAPVISGTPFKAAVPGVAFSFTPTATDSDGDTVSFSIANKPVNAEFDSETGEFTFVPGFDEVGLFEGITITATDGQFSDQLAPFSIRVLPDYDEDGLPNNCDADCVASGFTEDLDDDNDGVPDINDALPLDASDSVDTDGDGIGNNADNDDDGDGVLDNADLFPLDPFESADTDGDGTGDNADAFPLDPNETQDSDGDGLGDNQDALPFNASETIDTDSDGIGNNADTDDDGDGILDIDDHLPLEANSPAPSLGAFRGLLDTVTDHLEDDSDSGSVPVPMAKPAEERVEGEPTNIPSLPPLGLFALGGLISLLGIRKIRAT